MALRWLLPDEQGASSLAVGDELLAVENVGGKH